MIIVTIEELRKMRGTFKPCPTCGSSDSAHEVITVSRSRSGSIKVNHSSHNWHGPADDGMWWQTAGSSRARYFKPEQFDKALDYGKSWVGGVRLNGRSAELRLLVSIPESSS